MISDTSWLQLLMESATLGHQKRAAEQINDYSITFSQCTDTFVEARVLSSRGAPYDVTIACPDLYTCNCPDHVNRNKMLCKHIVMVCIKAIEGQEEIQV